MSDFDAGASAPSESAPAPAPEAPVEAVVTPPNPVNSEPVAPEPEAKPAPTKIEPVKPPSAREAIERAAAKVEKDNPPADKVTDKPEPVKTEGPVRDETGKFAPKDGAQPAQEPAKAQEGKTEPDAQSKPTTDAHEPPARFSPDAKAKWEATDPSVRAETARAIRELEQGHEKYRTSAAEWDKLKPFHDLATQNRTTVSEKLTHYVALEQLLAKDPVRGFETIARDMGFSLKDLAAHVMGQPADQVSSQKDAELRELRQEIASLKQTVGGVTKTFEDQRASATEAEVVAFSKANPRLEELAGDIAFFLKSDKVDPTLAPQVRLAEAYKLAERLNPAPEAPVIAAPAANAPDLSAQTRKGEKSISGAPGPGSDPATKRAPSPTVKDALARAFAAAGA